jgi:hypothetical protein
LTRNESRPPGRSSPAASGTHRYGSAHKHALFVVRRFARFSRLPADEARHYLERALVLGGPLGAMVLGVRTLVLLCFYQHPDVLRTLEVDWAGRARELTDRRAILLGE